MINRLSQTQINKAQAKAKRWGEPCVIWYCGEYGKVNYSPYSWYLSAEGQAFCDEPDVYTIIDAQGCQV